MADYFQPTLKDARENADKIAKHKKTCGYAWLEWSRKHQFKFPAVAIPTKRAEKMSRRAQNDMTDVDDVEGRVLQAVQHMSIS